MYYLTEELCIHVHPIGFGAVRNLSVYNVQQQFDITSDLILYKYVIIGFLINLIIFL